MSVKYTVEYCRNNKVAVHCKTPEEWDKVTSILNYKWQETTFDTWGNGSAINCTGRGCAHVDYYHLAKYTVITAETFIAHNSTEVTDRPYSVAFVADSLEKKGIHELKTWCEYYQEVFMGHKTFEVRKNDREFKRGDILILREWDNVKGEYTGRQLARNVTYILHGGSFGLDADTVVMGNYIQFYTK